MAPKNSEICIIIYIYELFLKSYSIVYCIRNRKNFLTLKKKLTPRHLKSTVLELPRYQWSRIKQKK